MRDDTILRLASIGAMFGLAAIYDGQLALIAVGVFAGMLTGDGFLKTSERRQAKRAEKTSDGPADAKRVG